MKTPQKPTTLKRDPLSQTKILALAAMLFAPAATVFGQAFWNGGASDFNVPGSWNPTGVPTGNASNDSGSNNVVLIQPGDPVWGHGDTLAGQGGGTSGSYLQTGSTNNTGYPSGGSWMRLGIGTGGTAGYYTLSNGVVNVAGQTHLGENGTGYLEVDGGTYNTGYNGNPGICAGDGDFGPSTGTLILTGGTINNINNETWFGEANSACTGTLIMSGGTLNANNWFVFGRNGGIGFGTVTGGTINFTGGGQFLVGGGGIGSLIQSGGIINVFNQYLVPQGGVAGTNILSGSAVLNAHSWLAVGRNGGHGELDLSGNASITRDSVSDGGSHFDLGASGVGVFNQNGGAVTNTTSAFYLGESGAGTWNFNGGTAILANVIMCVNSSASGILNLNSGLFQTAGIASPTPAAVSFLNLNGATLQANANNSSFITGLTSATIGSGGITLDSQGFNITIPQVLGDAGGGTLAKIGSGTVTLTGANSYAGNTAVNAGTLATTTASSNPGNLTVADTAAFGLAVLSQGGQYSVANLALGSSTGASLNFDMGAFGNPTLSQAPLNILPGGTFTANGTTTINIADALPQLGDFPLIQYQPGGRTGNGNFVLGPLPVGVVAVIVTNTVNNSIDLNITGVNQPRWDGQAGGTWDLGSDTNWVNIGTGLATAYADGSPVVFDDNAQGTTTVNLTTTVNPHGITVANNSLTYTLVGTGKISGTSGLTVQGTGSFSVLNTGGNTYTGPTTINNGTLVVTNLANGGSPSALGASSSSSTNLVLNGGDLTYNGPTITLNRAYSTTATNSGLTTTSNLTFINPVTAGPLGSLFKSGLGTITYTAATNTLSGAGSLGFIVNDGAVTFNGSNGGQTNVIGGTRLGVEGLTSTALVLITNSVVNTAGNIDVGDAPSSSPVLTVDGTNTTVNLGGWLIFGDGGNVVSTVNLNNGTINVNNGKILMGGRPSDTSTLNINAGFFNNAGGQAFDIADGNWNGAGARTATVNQIGGTNFCNNNMSIGNALGGTGFYNLSSGVAITTGEVDVGNGGAVGTLNISGGSFSIGSWFTIGRAGSSGCVVNMTGGTLSQGGGGNVDIGTGAGDNSALSSGTFNQSAGTFTVTNEYWIGENNASVGTNNISGTAVVNVNSYVTVGRAGLGVANISGGAFNQTGGNPFIVGIFGGGTGIWNQTGGSLTTANDIWLGQGDPNANGTVNLNAGTITNSGWLAVGREGGTGVFNVNGGTYVRLNSAGNVSIAHGGGTGTVNVNSGSIDTSAGQTWMGEDSNLGTWNMNGGTANLSVVHLAQNASASGILNLNGGSLTATEITTGNTGSTNRTLNFNGGTLRAGAGNLNFIHDLTAANVASGGAIFNTAGNTVGVNQALLGVGTDGGLTKNGNGTLYLNAANTYTNTTAVNAGILGGNGTILGPVTIGANGALAAGTSSIGTLTISNTLNFAAGSTNIMKINLATNDQVAGLSAVTYSGSLVVKNVSGNTLTVGQTYKLFSSAAAGSGNFASVTVLPSGAGTFNPATGVLTITAGGVPFKLGPTRLSGNNLIITASGGTPNGAYALLTATNLTTPLAAWTTNLTGTLDGFGAFSNSIPINPTQPAAFFRLLLP